VKQSLLFKEYDIIVVGAGHAGCEAAVAAAKLGSSVLLISMNLATPAQMSCNPAIGGVAKGQIVREIDALGGQTGIVTDRSMIQFRMLNKSKGPAMWSPRAQCDRIQFSIEWKKILENTSHLHFWQDSVVSLLIDNDKVCGVKTLLADTIKAKAVIICGGTFLNGVIHIGTKSFPGGRIGEAPAYKITEELVSIGFQSARMKTGTPVRVDGRSLDYSLMVEQKGDENPEKFSFTNTTPLTKQKSCWLTYTNPKVHEILRTGFGQSPLFTGRIKGIGPRYCPSIEDKIERFSERDRHQLFVEPDGWDTYEIYLNGFSSSLPVEIQYQALLNVPGFENAKILRPGYAIEYDFFPPTQLHFTLETKLVEHLYFAGQINGTTGYEEAACQGLMAGINAHRKLNNLSDFVLTRSDAYIGVLIDDLVLKGTEEPYRMFTSRAEYRIVLRQDNADTRLSTHGRGIGLLAEEQYKKTIAKIKQIETLKTFITENTIEADSGNEFFKSVEIGHFTKSTKLANLLSRPQINLKDLLSVSSKLATFVLENNMDEKVIEESEILIKYKDYILKEKENIEKFLKNEHLLIHDTIDYKNIKSLSNEAREKLIKIKPKTIGQASRISGISPSDISILLVYIKK